MQKINLWTAIAEMRKLTAKGIPFSFEHFTWDSNRQKASGRRVANKAILRPAARGDDLVNSDHKLFYEDLNITDPAKNKRVCWQILIVKFNGIEVTPKQVFYENI